MQIARMEWKISVLLFVTAAVVKPVASFAECLAPRTHILSAHPIVEVSSGKGLESLDAHWQSG